MKEYCHFSNEPVSDATGDPVYAMCPICNAIRKLQWRSWGASFPSHVAPEGSSREPAQGWYELDGDTWKLVKK